MGILVWSLLKKLTKSRAVTSWYLSQENHLASVKQKQQARQTQTRDLPIEIIAVILDQLGDWELTRAIGVHLAMISGDVSHIRAADPLSNPPTKIGAEVAIRFGYVNVLEFFLSHHHDIFLSVFQGDLIPIRASRHGRTAILSWWKHG
ncbi:hypothetical protein MPER_03407, partial [Moniliophthora perniciosa FA553]